MPSSGAGNKNVRQRRGEQVPIRPAGVGRPRAIQQEFGSTEQYLVAVGERIRERREELGYSNQNELADVLGTSQSYVSKVERGDGIKALVALLNLCHALNCSLDFLALRTDDPIPFIPENIDSLTIVYQPENEHHKAILVALIELMEDLSPKEQMSALTFLNRAVHGEADGIHEQPRRGQGQPGGTAYDKAYIDALTKMALAQAEAKQPQALQEPEP
jgi:transcriptional regulator with XRE-family HTH domain